MKKSFLSIVLTLCMVLAMLPAAAFASGSTAEFAGGTGVESDPYLISTTAQLNNVRNYLGAHFKMVNDIEFTDADFAEGGAFYNDGAGWAPIGDATEGNSGFVGDGFTGTFDGNGYTVKNLYIYISGNSAKFAGLFGFSSGTIKNLGMVDGSITAVTRFEHDFAGSIVGVAAGTVTNCYNTGTVSGIDAGGIAGYISNGSISACYNTGNVTGRTYAGGIAGHIWQGTITNCYNTGSVSGRTTSTVYAGGITGFVTVGTVTNCYNTGTVSATATYAYAGDIVSAVCYDSPITNCYYIASIGDNRRGIKCTDAQMKQQSTFVGFDFTDVWTMAGNATYPYPELKALTHKYPSENFTEFAGGTGMAGDPYLISTTAHLNNVRNYLGAHFKMANDIEFTDADFAEGGAFYNGGAGWTPIGDKAAPFTGVFDGGEYAIKNLYINITGTATVYAGLFGYNSGAIRNLGMVDGEVSATTAATERDNAVAYVGSMVGYGTGSMDNCYSTGDVSAAASSNSNAEYSYTYAGGIAGSCSTNVTISNCYYTGDVSAAGSSDDTYDGVYACAGGITAYANNGNVIDDCYVTGNVSAFATGGFGSSAYAGGIASRSAYSSTITDSYATGSVSAAGPVDTYVGGIVGYADGVISNCYNTSSLSASSDAKKVHIGGIVGVSVGRCAITNCHNSGSVAGGTYAGGIAGFIDNESVVIRNSYNEGTVSGSDAGGIAGNARGTITNCYNTGNVTGTKPVSGNVGGIVGYVNYDDDARIDITNCYNTGTINGNNAGGIVGNFDAGTVTNSYNTGSVTGYRAGGISGTICQATIANCYNTGAVDGPYAGGITGYVYYTGSITNSYNTGTISGYNAGGIAGDVDGSVTNCYNVGSVTGTTYAGGVAGYIYRSTVTNCYYLDNIAKGIGGSAFGATDRTKRTSAQLQQQATFSGFDFADVWTMSGNAEYPYPELQENTHNGPVPLIPITFADIDESSWQYPFAQYAVRNGLMAGKGTDEQGNIKFDPNSPIKREEFVQVLYNAEGKPAVTIPNTFPDVADGGWYKNAVLWAKQNDIASGKGNGNFGVGENISRQDLAMMLYKYAKLNGYSLDATEGLINQFADGDMVAGYAKTAMDWAVSNGIMSGKGAAGADLSTFRLDPTGIATRAECAAMLKNFRTAFEY